MLFSKFIKVLFFGLLLCSSSGNAFAQFWRNEHKPAKCKDIGKQKIKDHKIPKRLRDRLSKKYENFYKTHYAKTNGSETHTVGASEADSIKKTEEEILWFSSKKVFLPPSLKVTYSEDEDPWTPQDEAIFSEIVRYSKYGYTVVLTERIPIEDINSGVNTSYKRANRMKTKLISMGLSADQIFIESENTTIDDSSKRIDVSYKTTR